MVEYISEKGANTLRAFKYKGGSVAFSYQYVWSPIAEKLVSLFPKTVAPNLITLIGTIIHLIGNISLVVQDKPYVLESSLLFFGLCVIVYYNLDNVDGKQARRTGNSTPLGMCMDHGCDALGVSFIALGVARVINIDNNVVLLITAQVAVLGSFWLSVWAQYHNDGVLLLGKVNAVDDGIPFVASLGFFTYFVGQNFWAETTIFGICTAQIGIVAFIWIAGTCQTISMVAGSKSIRANLGGALTHFLHYPPLTLSLLSVIYLTNWHHDHFFAVYFTTTLIVVRDTSYMHVCVVAEQKYNQWQTPTLVYILAYPLLTGLTYALQLTPFVQALAVYGLLAYVVYSYLEYVVVVSRQMATILGIRIFHIEAKKEVKKL